MKSGYFMNTMQYKYEKPSEKPKFIKPNYKN